MTRKPYSVPDQALWDDVARTLSPLKNVKGRGPSRLHWPSGPKPAHANARDIASPAHPAITHRSPPPLQPFERRLAQRLLRGQIDPDARLDLHGETLESARLRLLHFLQANHQMGAALVLVITGKGGAPGHTLHGRLHRVLPEHNGRLRRELPHFLQEAAFRAFVVGYQPAHPRHGGGGAFYVKLRRRTSRADVV